MMKKIFASSQYLAVISLLVIFVIDFYTPDEYVVDTLYLISVFLVFRHNSRTIIGVGMSACLLIVISVFIFGKTPSLATYVNRAVAIVGVIVTTYIAIHYRKINFSRLTLEQQHAEAIKKMLFITSHQVRKPVANILGLAELIFMAYENGRADDIKKECEHLQISAIELDRFVLELTRYIEQHEKNA